MQKWYYLRGYQLAEIILNDSANVKNSTIDIIIKEGIVSKIEFISYANKHDFIRINEILSIEFLLSMLNICPGQVLNIKYLEAGIRRLKYKKFFTESHYELVCNNYKKNTWNLVFRLRLYSNKSLILYNNYINLQFYFNNLLRILSHNTYESMLYTPPKLHINLSYLISSFLAQIFDKKSVIYYYFSNLYLVLNHHSYLSKIYINLCNCLVQTSIIYHNLFLYFAFSQYLHFQYYNPCKVNENFILHTVILNNLTGIYMCYQNSWMYKSNLSHNKYNHNIICYFKTNCIYNTHYALLSLYNFNNYLFYQIANIHVKLIYQISNVYDFIQEISVKFFENQYVSLYNYITRYTHHDNRLNRNNYASCYKLKILQEHQTEKSCKISISCIFYNLNTYINKMQVKSIKLQYIFCLFKKLVKYNLNKNLNFYHKLSLNTNQYYWLNQSLILCRIHLIKLFTFRYFSPFPDKSYIIDVVTIRGYKNRIFLLSPNILIVNLEYKVPVKHKYKFCIFIDYLQYLSSSSRRIYNNLLFLPSHWLNYNFFTNFKVGYGISMEFIIPINQSPFVNIEYSLNIHGGSSLNLRMIYKNNHLY